MSELVTIAAANLATANAQLAIEESIRPGKAARILRRGVFKMGRFNLVPDQSVEGQGGAAERNDGVGVYLLVVEFS